jgi:hypothetical protein
MSINYNNKVCEKCIICTDSIKVLGTLLHSQFFYHHHVDRICSQSLKILGLLHMLICSLSAIGTVLVLYFTQLYLI